MLTAGALASAVAVMCAQAPAADPLIQAMHDEVNRSVKLNIPNLEAPYFVEYVLDESDSFTVAASLGGLLSRSRDRFRVPEIHVRVGDYKFDNTNFAGGAGSRFNQEENFPLDDDYPVLRRYLWLETDSVYKGAVEAISRKRAAMRNINQNEQLDDFARAVPVHLIKPFEKLSVDEKTWLASARTLSALFTQYPDVKTSEVQLHADAGGYYVVNSEGTEVQTPENVAYVRARATAQSADGMTLHDSVTFHALDAGHLPSEAEMTRGITRMAENLVALARAPKGEDYNGPVLFEAQAGPQIFAEILAKNLALSRTPAGARGGATQSSEFEGRLGARILPDTFEVVDDPTQKEWRGKALFGSYDVDREGVIPAPLHLVEKGTLKGFLLTRQPVRGFEGSNGRARLPGRQANVPDISNLFVSSSETIPAADMKKKLIELIQARNKPYGIIVRQMDFPSAATRGEVVRLMQGAQGATRPVSMPLLVYKVFPDGREELVRGMRFRGFNARSLKDILAAGDDATVFDFMDSLAPFAMVDGGEEYTTEACVVAPSIIIDDLELHPVEDELPKLPVVPAPELVK
jgi:hypothetical protein